MAAPQNPSFDNLPEISMDYLNKATLAKDLFVSTEPAPNMTESGIYVPNSNMNSKRKGVYRRITHVSEGHEHLLGRYVLAVWPNTSYMLFRSDSGNGNFNLVYVQSVHHIAIHIGAEDISK